MMRKFIFILTLLTARLSLSAQHIIRPDYLQPGDTIAILSPASLPDEGFITAAEKVLKEWGYATMRGKNVLNNTHGTFAGSKEQRKADLVEALANPNIKAILCSRGGYGSVQEIQEIPFKYIKKHPKWIIGYSDITVAHSAWVNSGVMSIHAHMAEHLMNYEGKDTSSLYLRDMLAGKLPVYQIPSHKMNHLGEATATLIGGNLSVLCGLTGSYLDFFHQKKNYILFVEDVEESFDHIDRYMNLLKLNGELKYLKGIIIGQFTHYDHNGDYPDMNDVFEQYLKDLNIPVIYNFPVGHVNKNYPMIEGCKVQINVTPTTSTVTFLP